MGAIRWVGFDADDTLWKSEDYYRAAEADFEAIVGRYIDLSDRGTQAYLLEVERRNLKVFGYGGKGMTLSMIEAAIELTDQRISAADLHRIVEIGRATLAHPVELIDGIREAVQAIAAAYPVVLITKGDLFHHEQKAFTGRHRAKKRKPLKCGCFTLSRRRKKSPSCSPMRPCATSSCPGFATISGAA